MLRLAVEPLVLFFLVVAVGCIVRIRYRRVGNSLLGLAVLGLYTLATPFVSARLLHSLERGMNPASMAAGTVPQAIVVLGADLRHASPEYGGDTVGRLTLERLRYGVRLHRKTGLPLLVSGGSIGNSVTPLAVAMKKALQSEFDVSVRWVEPASRNTFENARLSAAILRKAGITRIYLVTHAWHMPRAVESFTFAGLTVTPAPTAFTYIGPRVDVSDFVPDPDALLASHHAIHEWVGRIWYRWVYFVE